MDKKARDPTDVAPRQPDEHGADSLEDAFASFQAGSRSGASSRIYGLIPEEIIRQSPEEFAAFLESVLLPKEELEAAVEQCLSPAVDGEASHPQRVQALIPPEVLHDPVELLQDLFEAFEELEEVVASFRAMRRTLGGAQEPEWAVVPDVAVADPSALLDFVGRLESDAQKLEILLRQARHDLRRLTVYRLSRRPPGQLISEMRKANDIPTLQYLVDFVCSIHHAAISFEKLEIPRPHIRDFLEHLYRMEDWVTMRRLVSDLEEAVKRFTRGRQSSTDLSDSSE
jgi:hypothetical protein